MLAFKNIFYFTYTDKIETISYNKRSLKVYKKRELKNLMSALKMGILFSTVQSMFFAMHINGIITNKSVTFFSRLFSSENRRDKLDHGPILTRPLETKFNDQFGK